MKKALVKLLVLILFSCQAESEPTYYNLSVSVTPSDSGTVSPQTGEYEEGSSVTIRATGNSNFVFDSWSGNASGSENPLTFTMDRNKNITANFSVADSDGDGVNNSLDQCNNTPSGATVNAQGCATSQIDTDGDGVYDDVDQDNETRSGVPVDENGVMQNPIYLDENGVTIKARNWAIVGDSGEIGGITFTVISEDQLRNKVDNGDDLSNIVTSKITDFGNLFFLKREFNQDISSWDTSNVTSMYNMFTGAESFNQPLNSWDVSNVQMMGGMFSGALSFNQPLYNWDVSNVTNMDNMFGVTDNFNQDISQWDTSSVTTMVEMFQASNFNQDISGWNVSNVENMSYMFIRSEAFNQNISTWDTSNVVDMTAMFYGATNFNQDLRPWCVSQIPNKPEIFSDDSLMQYPFEPLWGRCPNDNDLENYERFRLFIIGGRDNVQNATRRELYPRLYQLISDEIDTLETNVYSGVTNVLEGIEICYEIQGKLGNLGYFLTKSENSNWYKWGNHYLVTAESSGEFKKAGLISRFTISGSDEYWYQLDIRPVYYGNRSTCYDDSYEMEHTDNGISYCEKYLSMSADRSQCEINDTCGYLAQYINYSINDDLRNKINNAAVVRFNDLYR